MCVCVCVAVIYTLISGTLYLTHLQPATQENVSLDDKCSSHHFMPYVQNTCPTSASL